MKNTNDSKSRIKKQLMSGAVYIALAVTVVAVTVSTITASFSGSVKKSGSSYSIADNTIYGGGSDTNFTQSDFGDFSSEFSLDTPVSDVKEGVSAKISTPVTKEPAPDDAKEDEQPPANAETASEQKTEKSDGNAEAPSEVSPQDPDKSKPVAEEPAEATFELGYEGYIKPCTGYIAKEFSTEVPVYSATMYDYRTHPGIDIACEAGSPVKAVTNGVISEIYDDYMLGTTVVIEHADGISSYYSNLSPDLPTETVIGRTVATGEVIGGIGSSALCESAEASHLHFEMKKHGIPLDPDEYLPQ